MYKGFNATSELLDIHTSPPFEPHNVHSQDLFTDAIGGMALKRILEELPTSVVAQESLAQTAIPSEAKRVVETIPFLRALSDELVKVVDGWQLSGAAYMLGSCLGAITLEYATDYNSCAMHAFDDSLRERAEEFEKTKADQYRPEDRMDVLLQAMSMLDWGVRTRAAEALTEELADKVQAASLPKVAKWAKQRLHGLSNVEGASAGAENNPWREGLIDTKNEFEALRDMMDTSSLASAIFELIGNETMSDSNEPPNVQFVAGINRVLAFVAVGVERLAANKSN